MSTNAATESSSGTASTAPRSPAPLPGTGADGPDLHLRFEHSVPVLGLPESMPFEPLRSWLRAVLPGQLPQLGGLACRLDFGSRPIVLFDLRRLVSFLRQEFGIEVTGLYVCNDVVTRFAERELKLKLFTSDGPPADLVDAHDEASEPIVEAATGTRADDPGSLTPIPTAVRDDGGRRSMPVRRTLRSGAQIRFDGDVQVYGDINPGAHVVATGNIMVFGALKGVAHAGAHGDDHAFILAFDMRPTQLRIARRIAIPSPKPTPSTAIPEIATLQDDQLTVQPFKGRIPS